MYFKDLLSLALSQAKEVSLNTYPNKVVCVYVKDTEFTIISEDSTTEVLAAEPDLKLVTKLLNGEVIK